MMQWASHTKTDCEMNEMSTSIGSIDHTSPEWTTPGQVQKHFAAAMTDLFCLAFLLTAHAEKAEVCVIRSIRECLKATRIQTNCLAAWVRNSIIRNGIAIVNESEPEQGKDDGSIPLVPPTNQASIRAGDYSAGIFDLSSFDRLVYVICVLEHYTSRHCALLLRTSREKVREARIRALAHIAEFESRWRESPHGFTPEPNWHSNEPLSMSDSSCGCLLDH